MVVEHHARQEGLPAVIYPYDLQQADQSFSFGPGDELAVSPAPEQYKGSSTPLPGLWRRADPLSSTALQGQMQDLQRPGPPPKYVQEQSRSSVPPPSGLYTQGSLRSQHGLPGQIERSGICSTPQCPSLQTPNLRCTKSPGESSTSCSISLLHISNMLSHHLTLKPFSLNKLCTDQSMFCACIMWYMAAACQSAF